MHRHLETEVIGQMKFGLDDLFADSGFIYRIVSEDGKHYIGTRDWVSTRINLTIEKGMVVKATIG